jgi:hypothetical protein
VTRRDGRLSRLLGHVPGASRVAAQEGDVGLQLEGLAPPARAAQPRGYLCRLARAALELAQVLPPGGQAAQLDQRAQACRGRLSHRFEQRAEIVSCLAGQAAHVPVTPDGGGQPQAKPPVAVLGPAPAQGGAQVRDLGVDLGEPFELGLVLELDGAGLGPAGQPGGVPPCRAVELAGRAEPFTRVGAHRRQHPHPLPAAGFGGRRDEVRVDQRIDRRAEVTVFVRRGQRDLGRGLRIESAREDPEPAKYHPRSRIEQVITPVEQCSQAAVPFRHVPGRGRMVVQ